MSVTPDVSHVEMWPYVDLAAVGSANQSRTAFPIVLSVMASVIVQLGLCCTTPHDYDAHGALRNASEKVAGVTSSVSNRTPSSTHQPRAWLKAVAPLNV